jgi:hypothetical protein
MRTRFARILAPLLSSASVFAQSADHPIRIIPTPQQVEPRAGVFKVTAQTRIVLGEGSLREDLFAAEQINQRLKELKSRALNVVNEQSVRKLSANYIYIGTPRGAFAREVLHARGVAPTVQMKEEGYVLDIENNGVVLVGESSRGRYYGVMSFVQLLERQKQSIVAPNVSIRDWPAQKIRGITDDISRGQVSTMENFKKIIRFLSRYKLNVYSPYLEDMFVFTKHPRIGKDRGALTAAQVKELDAYAKKYHVELIPIFETLGHWENILSMPEYLRYAEFPGAHTLNISDERVYTLLDEMIGELSAAWSSPYFNMAADESWDVGLGASKQRVARSDIATVHAEHYKRLFAILKKYKKKPMMYGDILLDHPAITEKIPKDVIIVDWHYGAAEQYPSPASFKNAGFPFVVSPAVWNFTGPFPNYLNTVVNIQNLNRDGYLNGSLGILTSNWNDNGGEALRELNYYGYAWTAECAWQPLRAQAEEFDRKFFADFFGSDDAVVPAQTIYAILSNPFNQYHWFELWRHPMLPLRASNMNYLWRIQSIESTMPLVHHLLDRLAQTATRNKEQLDYLKFVSDLNLWFATKLRVGEHVRQMTSNIPPAVNRDSLRTAAQELITNLLLQLKTLKDRFHQLWLTTNRPENLHWLMMRYDRQAMYWEEKIAQLQNGVFWVDPLIESRWIYHPNANPRTRDSSATQVPKAYFRKTFSLDTLPKQGMLQLMGDTHARLWLNGQEIGEVYARPSLSLSVEHQRVKLWDVLPSLVQGNNVLAVEAANYDTFGSAGCNVFLELQSTATRTILSDSTWKVTATPSPGWQMPMYSDTAWVQAVSKPYPFPVVRPQSATRRTSWIER